MTLRKLLLCWLTCGALLISWRAGRSATPNVDAAGQRMLASVKILASDEFEGRGIGTEGLRKAQEFVANAFRDAGLNVTVAGGDPYEEFDVVDGAELMSPNTLHFQSAKGESIDLAYGTDFETCSFGEAGKFSAPIVFCGYGIESTDPAYNDFEGVDIRDKVVLMMRRNPQQGRDNGMFSAGPHGGTSRHAALRTKVSHAFRQGAAAILFVNDPYSGRNDWEKLQGQLKEAERTLADAKTDAEKLGADDPGRGAADEKVRDAEKRVVETRQVVKDFKPDPLMEFGYGGPRAGKAVPILNIRQTVCDKLLQAAIGKSLEQIEKEIDETGRPRSADLKGWRAEGETSLIVKHVQVANVVGVLEGEGPLADETIVIGAHYDHLGYGGDGSLAPGSHDIHNGADDNASGTAALIEVANRYGARSQKPARRMVFIAFTGEERGLLGSAEYVKEPLFPIENTIAMFNMDMVGRLEEDKLTVFGAGTSPRWKDLIEQAGRDHQLSIIEKPEGFGPSDHSSFYGKQIPVLHLFTGTHNDYHRPSDDWEKINAEGMSRIVDFLEEIVDDTLKEEARPTYIAIQQKATLNRSGNRPYFGSIPDFGTETEGYALQGVAPGSPADKAGLRAGDVIVELGGEKIGSLDDFDLALRKFSPGQQVTVKAQREGKVVSFQVVLATPRS